jgi:hypothetical protein
MPKSQGPTAVVTSATVAMVLKAVMMTTTKQNEVSDIE